MGGEGRDDRCKNEGTVYVGRSGEVKRGRGCLGRRP